MRWRWCAGSSGHLRRAGPGRQPAGAVAGGAGAGPESVVAVVMARSAQLVAALLAVLKAGAAYLPVDPGYPAERVRFMLADARPVVTVTDTASAVVLDRLEDLAGPVLAPISAAMLAGAACTPRVGAAALRPGHPAYVIYTSGSTGTQGCGGHPRGLVNLAAAQIERFGTGPGSRVLQFASPSFDASVSEMAMALCSGAALVVQAGDLAAVPAGLEELAARCQVTHLTAPPGCWPSGQRQPAVSVTLAAAAEALARAGGGPGGGPRRFLDAYGPTETTVCATMSGPLSPGDPPHIGSPIANTQVFVLDAVPGSGAGGGGGGIVRSGCGAGAGVCGPCGADGGAVCGLPVRAGPG